MRAFIIAMLISTTEVKRSVPCPLITAPKLADLSVCGGFPRIDGDWLFPAATDASARLVVAFVANTDPYISVALPSPRAKRQHTLELGTRLRVNGAIV